MERVGKGTDARQDASDRDAALAHLATSSLHLMAHLNATCHRADYDAASRGCLAMKEFSIYFGLLVACCCYRSALLRTR